MLPLWEMNALIDGCLYSISNMLCNRISFCPSLSLRPTRHPAHIRMTLAYLQTYKKVP
jgi:hypothetical protein